MCENKRFEHIITGAIFILCVICVVGVGGGVTRREWWGVVVGGICWWFVCVSGVLMCNYRWARGRRTYVINGVVARLVIAFRQRAHVLYSVPHHNMSIQWGKQHSTNTHSGRHSQADRDTFLSLKGEGRIFGVFKRCSQYIFVYRYV